MASGAVCVATLLLSVPVLVSGILLDKRASFDCVSYLETPLIVVGSLLMFFSLSGICNLCHDKGRRVAHASILSNIFNLCFLFGYTVFAFSVSYKETVEVTAWSGHEEYTLKGGNNWLQKRVKNNDKWWDIKHHLQKEGLCSDLAVSKDSSGRYFYEDPSPAQSGCCKPPYECGFIYRNATGWDAPRTGLLSNNTDCTTWSNEQTVLCYDCLSCKGGVVAITRREWKKAAIINIVVVSVLFVVYQIGCWCSIVYGDP